MTSALAHAPHYGFDVRTSGHDWPALKRGRDAYVLRLNGIYERNLAKKRIVTVRAAAAFASATELVTAAGERYTAPHIVIATGGSPLPPALPGAELALSSNGFFELERLPKRIAIVGSGFAGLGNETHGAIELLAAIAACRAEDVAGEALRVGTNKDRVVHFDRFAFGR